MKTMIKTMLALFVLSMLGCTNPDKAREVLAMNGYTDVEIVGYDPFRCSDSDDFSTEFNATNSAGVRVNGVVCSGLMKGATIRF